MANNPGAKKAIRKIAARTEVNKSRRTRVRTFLRKFQEAVTGGDAAAAQGAHALIRLAGLREVERDGRAAHCASRKRRSGERQHSTCRHLARLPTLNASNKAAVDER